MNEIDDLNEFEKSNRLVHSIEMSLRAGLTKHDEFVKRHKEESDGAIEKLYKVYCFENDFENNERVERYWNSINPNVNDLYEFKHLTALRQRGREEVIEILRTEAVTDILIESNLLDREQFLSLVELGRSIHHRFLGTYLKSVTFLVSDIESFKEEIKRILDVYGNKRSKEGFMLLCKNVDVKLVEHFDKSTETKM